MKQTQVALIKVSVTLGTTSPLENGSGGGLLVKMHIPRPGPRPADSDYLHLKVSPGDS